MGGRDPWQSGAKGSPEARHLVGGFRGNQHVDVGAARDCVQTDENAGDDVVHLAAGRV